jgi:hypothetical protein
MRALPADACVNAMPEFGSVEKINRKFMCGFGRNFTTENSLTADI